MSNSKSDSFKKAMIVIAIAFAVLVIGVIAYYIIATNQRDEGFSKMNSMSPTDFYNDYARQLGLLNRGGIATFIVFVSMIIPILLSVIAVVKLWKTKRILGVVSVVLPFFFLIAPIVAFGLVNQNISEDTKEKYCATIPADKYPDDVYGYSAICD